MAGHTSLAKGYDAMYPMRAIDPAGKGHSYYLSPTEQGEPAGRWSGRGAAELGLAEGSEVAKGPYRLLVEKRLDPRDGTTRLGRGPGKGQERAKALYLEFLAAEPHATAARRVVLGQRAQREAKEGPLYFDLTFSPSKSISAFYASLGENLRLARDAGDKASSERWAAELGALDEMLHAANRDMLAYFEREAGYTRTRSDGTVKYAEAGLAFASFLQHTSRDDDIQLHIHNVIAHAGLTNRDGKWRAPDSKGYGDAAVAAGAIGTLSLESRMTQRWGLGWTPRTDGYGSEVAGVGQGVMDALSSRRDTIAAEGRRLAAEFESEYGRKPTQGEMRSLAEQATLTTRQGKEGLVNLGRLQELWGRRVRQATGEALESVAPGVTGRGGQERPDELALWMAQAQAVELLQERKSSWTRQDLIQQIGWCLPAEARNIPAAQVPALLERLADEILAGGEAFRDVACLEAPEPVAVPPSLVRADGRTVYQRHGGSRYATAQQLTREERMLAQAGARIEPLAEPQRVAQLLGSDSATLDSELSVKATVAREERTATGLRLDQAAAVYQALCGPQRVTVLTGAAGTGKTHSVAALARAARKAGAPQVWGITTSQAARNVLADASARAGVRVHAMNSSQFLGDMPGRKGARPVKKVARGSVIIVDEASMMSADHLMRIIGHAAENGCRVVVAGDQEQLTAVEQGGGMGLLARRLGFVQLAEAQRFEAAWEREASLRLRAGDAGVLDEYAAHGRIHGGHAEAVMDEAARAAVARMASGRSVLLIAAELETCRELSRRVQGELVRLGQVNGARAAAIREGARAATGDLVICRKNDHEQGVANGDMFRVAEVVGGQMVLEEGDGERFTPAAPGTYDLAYGVTAHTSQGRTVDYGMAVATGNENRQALYVMASRGALSNDMYVFSESARLADPAAGTRPAPEIERHDRASGLEPEPAESAPLEWSREPAAVLADILSRDGTELSALEVRDRNLSEADNLGWLHGMFMDQAQPLRYARYAGVLGAELPAGYAADSYQSRWLYRTLETCERSGLDCADVVRQALASSSLEGARDVASVLDARIRKAHPSPVPLPPGPFADQVPAARDPQAQRFMDELAAAMDGRKERLGGHVAEVQPQWALEALGEVPADPIGRLDWERRASDVAAYRELFGFDSPTEAAGPEPTADLPVKRAWWQAARAAMGEAGEDMRDLADGLLVARRAMYEAETGWAPRFVRPELGAVRASAQDQELAAVRHEAEAQHARELGDAARAARHEELSASTAAAGRWYRQHEAALDQADQDYSAWAEMTEASRAAAIAADAELRRRGHVDLPALESAEPLPLSEEERAELDAMPEGLAAPYQAPAWLNEMASGRERFRAEAEARRAMELPDEDADLAGELAWPTTAPRDRDAVLQPPAPLIAPEAEAEAEREDEHEGV